MLNNKINKTSEKVLIFCQSNGDIKYFLKIKNKYEDYLVFVTLPSVYKTLIKIGNQENIFFIQYPKTFLEFLNFKNIYGSGLEKIKKNNYKYVFFFSPAFDWISLSIIIKLNNDSIIRNITLLDHYKNLPKSNIKNFRLGMLLRSIYYYYLTGEYFDSFKFINNREVVYLPNSKCNYIHETKFNFNLDDIDLIKCNIKQNSVLFIDAGKTYLDTDENIDVLNSLIKNIELKYNIYIKKHPNLPLSINFLNKFELFDQKNNFPLELLDVNEFIAVISISSAALFNNNCKMKISILNLLSKKNKLIEFERDSKYLKTIDVNNEINYPKSVEQLYSFLDVQ
tara:strand:- start:11436 stop:12449 length:1014 start_codon:yes stop_codon:yes gene_type:complete